MYKVLEVREYINTLNGSYHDGHHVKGINGGSVYVKQRHIIVVICENEESGKRERFEFYEGYEDKVLRESYVNCLEKNVISQETCCFGYSGDYDLLIIGDRFEIKETSTYKQVIIVTE